MKASFNRRDFIRVTGAGVITLALPPLVSTAASLGSVPQCRLDRLSKGANVARWFRFPPRADDDHYANYVSIADAEFMKRIGLTHVRLCIQPAIIMDPTSGAIQQDKAKYLDAAIARFQKAGLLVVVDIHNEDRPAELNPVWQEAFVRFWGDLAKRLSQFDPDLTIFEIINEPVFDHRENEWDVLNARLAAAIRKSAPQHTIMTSGPNWGGIDGLQKLKLLGDPNVVYSFHCYDPFPFTHQGATWAGEDVKPLHGVPYPSSPEAVAPLLPELESHPHSKGMIEQYGKQCWNKEKLAARFKQGIDWGTRNKVPLYCGEFGVFRPHARPEHRANWFHDFGQVLAENRIGWSVWGWDENFGLDVKHVDSKPVIDTGVAKSLGLQV